MRTKMAYWMVGAGLASSMLALSIQIARADGLPSRQAQAAPIISPKITCYGGAFGSGAFVHDNVNVATLVDMNMGSTQFGGGLELGCDYITSRWVVGVLGDYTFQSSKTANTLLGLTGNTEIGDEGVILGRLGIFTNDSRHTMVYVVAGAAFADKKSMSMATASMPLSGGVAPVIGGGIETVLATGLNGFVEYRHEAFEDRIGTIASILATKSSETEDRVLAGLRLKLY